MMSFKFLWLNIATLALGKSKTPSGLSRKNIWIWISLKKFHPILFTSTNFFMQLEKQWNFRSMAFIVAGSSVGNLSRVFRLRFNSRLKWSKNHRNEHFHCLPPSKRKSNVIWIMKVNFYIFSEIFYGRMLINDEDKFAY